MTNRFRFQLQHILKFSPGYDPSADVFGRGAHSTVGAVSPEEALFNYETGGVVSPCTNPEKFTELRQRKAMMDLTIQMWKDAWREAITDHGHRALGIFELSELLREGFHPRWLESTGLFKAAQTDLDAVVRAHLLTDREASNL